jgi:hypothetical protein
LPAQKITGLDYNHSIRNQLIEKKTGFKSTRVTPPFPTTSHLFFDDFSAYRNSVFPDNNLWLNNNAAFINQTYPDSCISIGVATLDAFDSQGYVYARNDSPTPSDTLTSKIIQTDTVTGNLYLSFFVQAGGKGDAPDEQDSLIVEFYIPDSLRWYTVWHSLGYESHTFEQVIIPIDSVYKTNSFQFRFRNYTSLVKNDAPGEQEGALGNSDLWHIDYVEVRAVTDENVMRAINDIAFTQPLLSSHEEYFAIPYNHLNVAISYRRNECPISFRTYFPVESADIAINRNYESWSIYDGIFNIQEQSLLNLNNVPPFITTTFKDFFSSNYSFFPDQKYGHYLLKSFLSISNKTQYLWNDTIEREEIFKNYYALDDGTAEYGFGLPGNGATGMRLANMFNLYTFRTKDTLSAVDIHFPHSRNNAHKNVEFSICIWKSEYFNDTTPNPGELLYPKGESDTWKWYAPDTNLKINEFMHIELTEDILVSDTIFVGLVQKGSDFINIGYDINTNSRSRIRFNDGNGWLTPINSVPTGSLMIRPVFGHKVYNSLHEAQSNTTGKITVYPNPAGQYITIVPENFAGDYENYMVSIYTILGQNIYSMKQLTGEMDISQLNSGMYIVRVLHIPSKSVCIQKFLKTE